MLRVSLHNAAAADADRFNEMGRMDIAYVHLDALATYKASMTMAGVGDAGTPVYLENYPRWSGSLWDIVARMVCLFLSRQEALDDAVPAKGRGAFATCISAVIEHAPDGENIGRKRLATAEVRTQRRRCVYVAHLDEDILGQHVSREFHHAPKRLNHWELLARGLVCALHGGMTLGPRPGLALPRAVDEGGIPHTPLGRLVEPARTGLLRWLAKVDEPLLVTEEAPSGLVPEDIYLRFLQRAV